MQLPQKIFCLGKLTASTVHLQRHGFDSPPSAKSIETEVEEGNRTVDLEYRNMFQFVCRQVEVLYNCLSEGGRFK